MAESKKSAPMDPTVQEGEYVSHVRAREPYAMEQLVSEVLTIFPDTAYEASNHNAWGVMLDAQFVASSENAADLADLLSLLGDPAYNEDTRITEVVTDEEGTLVRFRDDARTFDLRDPFGLPGAYAILTGGSL